VLRCVAFVGTKMDIGWLGFIASLGSLVCGPIYGWLLDAHGSILAVSLAAAACSIGCLIRGMAVDVDGLYVSYLILGVGAENLWGVVMSHVARHTEPADRITAISGYLFQASSCLVMWLLSAFKTQQCTWTM
jgi:MFS family permease